MTIGLPSQPPKRPWWSGQLAGLVLGCAALAGADEPTGFELEPVVTGLAVIDLASIPGEQAMALSTTQGVVYELRDGMVSALPLLDISDRVVCCGEQGMAAFAFHPQFPSTPYLYALYTSTEPPLLAHRNSVLGRFTWDSGLGEFDASSEELVLRIGQPAPNHNANDLAFGPDGMLYIATGDGGGQGDKFGNGQNGSTLNGKVLRIDVDSTSPYAVPVDNPFVGDAGVLDEIWSLGLRNPWRIGFDRVTGDLWIADAGQDRWEEIDLAPAGVGGQNFGWNEMEGFECYQPGCDSGAFDPPELVYCHPGVMGCGIEDCAVVGVRRYRGHRAPALVGRLVYVDYCSGRIRVGTEDAGSWSGEILYDGDEFFLMLGEDARGELYVSTSTTLYRVQGLPAGFSDGFESGDTSAWSDATFDSGAGATR